MGCGVNLLRFCAERMFWKCAGRYRWEIRLRIELLHAVHVENLIPRMVMVPLRGRALVQQKVHRKRDRRYRKRDEGASQSSAATS